MITKPITILLIDDHPVVRTGYRRLLESNSDMLVIGEADNGESGYQIWQEFTPDVTILDLNMVGICGFETMHRILSKDPTAKILIFSMLNNVTMVQRVIKAGASGFISKQSGIGEMIHAVRQVSSGKTYIESELAADLAVHAARVENDNTLLNSLSNREFQIFKLIAEGFTNAQIAEKISISPKTVSVHSMNLMRKLNLESTTQLIRIAISHKVIE
ncbi:MAG TPA: response regulator transcription factor [Nitrosomonas sp.]|nr:response regulator transcription factor [Nitrosomonas sp.]HQX13340.1 response regulator transcription factor [Nitrosomonas sp.]HRB31749.1 response regulator transcription factor [Nitrosomonas sp.]HRB44411.1 response regulator transcription factor [Nitrosomonas sp.]HRB77989.1 response regulator transcription factor [Nitrosomonas sp.]